MKWQAHLSFLLILGFLIYSSLFISCASLSALWILINFFEEKTQRMKTWTQWLIALPILVGFGADLSHKVWLQL